MFASLDTSRQADVSDHRCSCMTFNFYGNFHILTFLVRHFFIVFFLLLFYLVNLLKALLALAHMTHTALMWADPNAKQKHSIVIRLILMTI